MDCVTQDIPVYTPFQSTGPKQLDLQTNSADNPKEPNDLGKDTVGLTDEEREHEQRIEIANDLHPLAHVHPGVPG